MTARHAVLVTASREWTAEGPFEELLSGFPKGTLLIHGDARGGDRIAARVGARLGLVPIAMPVPPERWAVLGKRAGMWRNTLMLGVLTALEWCGYSVTVLGFPLPGGSGTQGCLREARRQQLDVVEWVG